MKREMFLTNGGRLYDPNGLFLTPNGDPIRGTNDQEHEFLVERLTPIEIDGGHFSRVQLTDCGKKEADVFYYGRFFLVKKQECGKWTSEITEVLDLLPVLKDFWLYGYFRTINNEKLLPEELLQRLREEYFRR